MTETSTATGMPMISQVIQLCSRTPMSRNTRRVARADSSRIQVMLGSDFLVIP